ncbi:phospholipid scramblase 2-like [Oppia nitens]|uniref:phospholipid scramblase 2-like n=1 Tax=Oppia nitens TaxID=1686743 RepID=UPI0023DCDC1E|nr:phospholipid scramblase 2-like [Oppia nitens]
MSYPYPPPDAINSQPVSGAPYVPYPPPNNTMYPPPGMPGYPAPQTGGYSMPGFQPQPQPPAMNVGYGQPPPQQGAEQWMNIPMGIPNCPPGLEYLTQIDQLLVHQKVELLEAFVGYESANKYSVKNSLGQKVYHAIEDNDCCTRNCCGNIRPFDMKILDNTQREVIHLYRPLRCDSCLFPCWLQKLEVSASGNIIGYITQEWSIFVPKFRVENSFGECVLRIEGPFCTFSMCGDVEFQILSRDGSVNVGKITKQWAGLIREAFTDADHFGITFPLDLDVNIKAVLLGACFLIDFMFFEKSNNKENDRLGMF